MSKYEKAASAVAGLDREFEAADADRATPSEIPQLLAALRGGQQGAAETMCSKFRYLAYALVKEDRRRNALDFLGHLFLALGCAVKQLANNLVDDAVKFISDELRRAFRKSRQPDRVRIAPNAATNSRRRKRGAATYCALTRVCCENASNELDDLSPGFKETLPCKLEDPALERLPYEDQSGNWLDSPDSPRKRDIATPICDIDRRLDLASTDKEAEVLEFLEMGCSMAQIQEHTSMTRYAVKKMVTLFRERAVRMEYAPPAMPKDEPLFDVSAQVSRSSAVDSSTEAGDVHSASTPAIAA